MGERPILFSGEMVRGILAGRKTQTRRPVKLIDFKASATRGYDWQFRDKRTSCWNDVTTERLLERWAPFGAHGATLWVRETWCDQGQVSPDDYPMICYRADGAWHHHDYRSISGRYDESFMGPPTKPWRPSIHMPRWASRLTLRVTDVRVERVQDITEGDAVAEGCTSTVLTQGVAADEMETAREQYERLWVELYGADSWDANPWVWVVAFEREEVRLG